MTQIKTKIPAELEPAAVGGMVTDSKYVKDRVKNKTQEEVNADTEERVSTLEESVGTGGSVDERIAVEKNRAEQAEGILDGKVATEKQRAEGVEGGLNTRLQTVEQLATISVGGGDIGIGTAADFESDDPEDLAKVPTIGAVLGSMDDEPSAGSNNLVKSGGVAELNFTSTNETHNLLTDISEQPTLKGYVDTNRDNKWIYDANRIAYMIPIANINGSKILYKKSTLGKSSIAFFDNYPTAGSVAPFVSGTTLVEDDTIVEIPSGTAYLYVAGPYGTSDYLPSELISGTDIPSIVKQHTQQIANNTTDIEELKQDVAVFEDILPQVLDTTPYSIYIDGSTVKYQQGRQSVFFNIEAYKGTHIKLVAGSGANGSVIAILKSGAAIPNSSVEYATGYDALITESGEYFIPNDGNLLYVQIGYNTIDFTPNTLGVVMSAAETIKKEEARAKSVENTLSPKQFGYHNPALWCAPILPIVHGNRLELFKYGMTYQNFDFYDLCASISDHSALGDKYGRFRENAYFFDSDNNKQEFDITFRLKNDLEGYADIYGSTIQTHIVPFAKKSSPAQNKNILVVGDSWVEFGTWVNELSRRLLGNGGTPVADGLTNLTFIGTKNSNHDGSEHIPCEGYGGKHIEWFLENEASPFVFNGVFDVSQYVSTNNYSGIDYLLIVSGANAPTPIDAYKDFIDGFISYNPNIKVLIGSNVMRYNPYGQFLAGGAAFNFLESGIKSSYTLYQRAYYWNKNVQEMCDEYTSNVVKYVDLPSQVDSLNNFGYEEVDANNRNNMVKVKMGTNNVHPTDAAYGQVADAFYNAFHYWCL